MRGPPPPRRLRRLPWTAVGYAALDFETTGLDPRRDAVVSFGVVPVRAGRVVLGESVYREVAPDAPLTASSIVVHGLRPLDLASAPSLGSIRDELGTAIEGRFLLAWAAGVEAAFLATVFGGRRASWRRRIVDVLQLAALADRLGGVVAAPGDYALSSAADRLGVPADRPHHALEDALTTAQVFLVVMSRLEPRGYTTPRHLLRASRGDGHPAIVRAPGRIGSFG